jgi:hypothetical protein
MLHIGLNHTPFLSRELLTRSGGANLKYKGGPSCDEDLVSSKYHEASIYYMAKSSMQLTSRRT